MRFKILCALPYTFPIQSKGLNSGGLVLDFWGDLATATNLLLQQRWETIDIPAVLTPWDLGHILRNLVL